MLQRFRAPAGYHSRGRRAIGSYAFYNCRGLASLRFAAGSRLERVGRDAFCDTRLGQLAFPNAVEEEEEQ